MKILIIVNSPYHYINLNDRNYESIKKNAKEKIECIICGFEMRELTVCHLKCFKCGSELTCSDKGNYW